MTNWVFPKSLDVLFLYNEGCSCCYYNGRASKNNWTMLKGKFSVGGSLVKVLVYLEG